MKREPLFTLLLLFAMSFQVVHAFALDMLDTHEHHIKEYVDEFSKHSSVEHDEKHHHDACSVHSEFHTPYIIPQTIILFKEEKLSLRVLSTKKLNPYEYHNSLLKPPRT